MAQLIELDISSDPACESFDPKAVGSYLCNLHLWGENRIEHKFIQTGQYDPANLPIGSLVPVLLQVAEKRKAPYARKDQMPLSKLIGLSVIRQCMHPSTSQEGRSERRLVGERVETFGFVPDVNTFYPAEYNNFGNKLSMYGVSSHLRVSRPGSESTVAAQHLLATPIQEKEFPVNYAVPTLANAGHKDKAWLALRAMPDNTLFLETLVSREELLDTFQRVE